jgi:N-acetylglucosaminyldiphosphoundecaprenol N-acetyl-beta-D-mannosaminyltransferase
MINSSDMIVPDGAGIVLASKVLKRPVKQKVAGVELAEALLGRLAEKNKKLFLLGAKPGVAERAAEKMREKAPGLNICGTLDGFFKSDEDAVRAVIEADPDLVFVCLGAPKQEIWMHSHAKDLVSCTMMGLGGTLNIFAGEAVRAPKILIKLNLEWLHRLYKEPRRLGRMMSLPKYILTAVRFRLARR